MSALWQWLFNRNPAPQQEVPLRPAQNPLFKPLTIFKVILLGDSGTGKTSIMNMITKKTFTSQYKVTIGADFLTAKIPVNKELINEDAYDSLDAMIWDTAGPERFQSFGVAFYRGSEAVIIVYDISNKRSFDQVENWIKEFKINCTTEVVTLIVGNKSDLPRKVEYNSGLALARKHNALFFECAAKSYETVLPMFIELTTAVHSKKVMGDVDINEGRIVRKRREFRHITHRLRTNGSFCDILIATRDN